MESKKSPWIGLLLLLGMGVAIGGTYMAYGLGNATIVLGVCTVFLALVLAAPAKEKV